MDNWATGWLMRMAKCDFKLYTSLFVPISFYTVLYDNTLCDRKEKPNTAGRSKLQDQISSADFIDSLKERRSES